MSAASDPAASSNGDAKPASNPPDRRALCHRVLRDIYNATQPTELPPAWRGLQLTPKVRELRGPAAELADSLRANFSVDELLEVGVFERAEGEEPTLNAKLRVPSAQLGFITEDKCFVDIHSSSGALAYTEMPAVRYALARANTLNPEPLLLAVNNADVNWGNSLGYFCDWATGLDAIRGPDIRRILERDHVNFLRPKYRLHLVGWQPATLNPRPAPLVVKILEWFLRAERLYGIDTGRLVGAWLPTSATFSLLKLAIDFQDEERIRHLLAQSLADSIRSPADALYAIQKPPEPTYGEALRNLTQLLERCHEIPFPNQVRAAAAELNRIHEKSVTRKYYEEEAATSNPSKKVLLRHLARLANDLHESQSIFVTARRVISMETVQAPTPASPDQIKNQCRLVDELLATLKALKDLKG